MASEESLREAAALGLVVGALYQVQTYRALLPTLIGTGADDGLAEPTSAGSPAPLPGTTEVSRAPA